MHFQCCGKIVKTTKKRYYGSAPLLLFANNVYCIYFSVNDNLGYMIISPIQNSTLKMDYISYFWKKKNYLYDKKYSHSVTDVYIDRKFSQKAKTFEC